MIHPDIAAKYEGGGYPSGSVDISDIMDNANHILARGDKELLRVAKASIGIIIAKGYFPPYLNHRKLALFFMDSCIDTDERVFQ